MSSRRPLPARALAVLRCHQCESRLSDDDGAIRCEEGHEITDAGGWLDLWPGTDEPDVERTMESFGYEWNTFDDIRPEEERWWGWYTADVPFDRLGGALAVDLGCGKGRYTRFTAERVGTMIALDGSLAVEAAARNLADLDDVVVVRGDLRSPPLQTEAFDLVTCLGVLHHLPDPEAGFRTIARLLASGGHLLIYVYSRASGGGVRSFGLRAATALRRVTTRLPHGLLRAGCAPLAAALYGAFVLPGSLGERRGISMLSGLPLATYRGKPLRGLWLDTFDRLSAPIEFRYVWDDLAPWYEAAGLEVVAVRDDAGLFVLARRP